MTRVFKFQKVERIGLAPSFYRYSVDLLRGNRNVHRLWRRERVGVSYADLVVKAILTELVIKPHRNRTITKISQDP